MLVINKPQNMTSHDVVAILRKKFKTKKVGHTGTLDPMATGVLPICIGKATKIVDFLIDQKKTYRCEMALGSETTTQDVWGEVIARAPVPPLTEEGFKAVLKTFIGEIDQIPPMYSALKVNGQKLVDLARQGKIIERKARKQRIYAIDKIVFNGDYASFDVVCSKGTYIRTLCHDIGIKLGTFAHMTQLVRLETEPFSIDSAIAMDSLDELDLESLLIPVDEALSFFPKIEIPKDESLYHQLLNGVKVNLAPFSPDELQGDSLFYRVYYSDVFFGIAYKENKKIYIKKQMLG